MADEITATFHYKKDGQPDYLEDKYSVEDYVQASEKMNFGVKLRTLVHAIADFGHYAQPYLANQNGWVIGTDHELQRPRNFFRGRCQFLQFVDFSR